MVFQNNVLAGGAGGSGTDTYAIDQSIRFNDDDSAYLKKDYGSDGSQTTFTLSGWFKLGILTGTAHSLFATGFLNGSAADFTLYFSGDQLYLFTGYNGGTPANRLETTQLFRDFSAWYHIVFVADTTNAVSTERLRLYVNGSRVTAFDTETYPSQNDTLAWGDATYSHVIGASGDDIAGNLNSQTPRYHYDGYMTELVYIDGTALDPSSFGEYNSSGIWIPKDVSGLTFGTNGFHIDGRDSSDLGDDESGNGNDFTTSGLAAHDQVSDSPTNLFCVMNPLIRSTVTYSEGNLKNVISGSESTSGTMGASSGKWYFEVYINTVGNTYLGVCSNAATNFTSYLGQPESVGLNKVGSIYIANPTPSSSPGVKGLPSIASSDIIGVAFDVDNQKIWWSKNGQWYTADSASPSTLTISDVESGNNAYNFSFFDEQFVIPMLGTSTTAATQTANFGQEGTFAGNVTAGGNSDGNGIGNFKYSVPSGYLALCTKNLGS